MRTVVRFIETLCLDYEVVSSENPTSRTKYEMAMCSDTLKYSFEPSPVV